MNTIPSSDKVSSEVNLGDIVGVYHEFGPNCTTRHGDTIECRKHHNNGLECRKQLECWQHTVGGFVVNIVGSNIFVRHHNGVIKSYDRRFGIKVVQIAQLNGVRLSQLSDSLEQDTDEELVLPADDASTPTVPSPRLGNENITDLKATTLK